MSPTFDPTKALPHNSGEEHCAWHIANYLKWCGDWPAETDEVACDIRKQPARQYYANDTSWTRVFVTVTPEIVARADYILKKNNDIL